MKKLVLLLFLTGCYPPHQVKTSSCQYYVGHIYIEGNVIDGEEKNMVRHNWIPPQPAPGDERDGICGAANRPCMRTL